jgi:acetyl esterase/lipase
VVGGVSIYLDVYEPPSGTGPFPILVLVHGGSFKTGCKGEKAALAARLAGSGFVVFNIDYRTGCDPAKPPPDIDDPSLCGYRAPAPMNDVKAAILWARENASQYGADPTRLSSLGLSSGGALVYLAAGTGTKGGTAPDLAAAWSGPTELGYLVDGVTVACSSSNNPTHCTSGVANYTGCALDVCPAEYVKDSAITYVSAANPPTFVANSTQELIPFAEAQEYADALGAAGVTFELCPVVGSKHAGAMEDAPCPDGGSVFDHTVGFMLAHLG